MENMLSDAFDAVEDGIETVVDAVEDGFDSLWDILPDLYYEESSGDSESEYEEMSRLSRSLKFETIWSNWSGWSNCQTKYGHSNRFRKCRGTNSASKTCVGPSYETRQCSDIYCKENDCSKGNFQKIVQCDLSQ